MTPSNLESSENSGIAAGQGKGDSDGPEVKRRRCPSLPPVRAMITLVSCVLFQLTLGVSYTTGNLMPYLTSYLRNSTDDASIDYSTTLWVDQAVWIVNVVSMPLLGILEQRISSRLFLTAGWLTFTASFIGNYWALQSSFVVTVMVYGILQGLGQAIGYPGLVKVAVSWFPENKGLVSGIALAGFAGGAFVWNQVYTAWINPHNLSPDLTIGEDLYFTQPDVLSRVPSCYLKMGGMLGGIQLLCLLTISYPAPSTTLLETDIESKEMETTLSEDNPCDGFVANKRESEGRRTEGVDSEGGTDNPAFVDIEDDMTRPSAMNNELTDDELADQMTVVDILKSRITWTFLLFNFLIDLSFQPVSVFSKAYGQTFIHDDHFLALTASVTSAFNAAGRPIWGLLADRMGYMPVFLSSLGIVSCLISTFVLSDHGGKGMFFVWLCLTYFSISGVYGLTNPIMYNLFGGKNYIFAYGFVLIEGIPLAFMMTYGSQALKDAFGWHGLFLFCGSVSVLSLLVISSLVLDCGRPLPPRMQRALFARRYMAHKNRAAKQNSKPGT